MEHVQLSHRLKSLKGVAVFVVLLIGIHFFWKFTVKGDDADVRVSWLGIDVSAPFIAAADEVTSSVIAILGLVDTAPERLPENVLLFESGHRLRIVWSCTGLKQSVILLVILLVYPGPWKHKAWYIPSGLLLVWLFNLVRISVISAAYGRNPETFELLHEHLFKYLFYTLIFILWVIWEEKFARFTIQSTSENT